MTTNPNLDDEQITALSDTLYDALYAITPYAEPHFADETEGLKNAVLAVLAEEASHQWIQKQIDETGIRAMDFRNGMQMEMEPARELLASWVAAARTMLGDAPNYTETKVSMDVKVAESPEMYTLVVQRHAPGALTPHEARQKAEAKVAELEAQLAELEGSVRKAVEPLERLALAFENTGEPDIGRQIRCAIKEGVTEANRA